MRDVQVGKMKNFHAVALVVRRRCALLLERFHRRDHLLQLPDAAVIDTQPVLVQGDRVLGLLRRAHKVSLLPLLLKSKGADEPAAKNPITGCPRCDEDLSHTISADFLLRLTPTSPQSFSVCDTGEEGSPGAKRSEPASFAYLSGRATYPLAAADVRPTPPAMRAPCRATRPRARCFPRGGGR